MHELAQRAVRASPDGGAVQTTDDPAQQGQATIDHRVRSIAEAARRCQLVDLHLQLLGIALAIAGVEVIWRRLRRAAQLATQVAEETQRDIQRSFALRRGELGGATQAIVDVGGIESAEAWGTPTVTGPHAVSDTERLAHLAERMNAAERDRVAERAEWEDQLARLRSEILANTRQGWQLVLGGLLWSAVGTGLGMAA